MGGAHDRPEDDGVEPQSAAAIEVAAKERIGGKQVDLAVVVGSAE